MAVSVLEPPGVSAAIFYLSAINDPVTASMTLNCISALLIQRIACNTLTRSKLFSELVRSHKCCLDHDVLMEARVSKRDSL